MDHHTNTRASYAAYVEALKAGTGTKHGAILKIWGEAEERRGEWEEVVLAGYSSLRHFCDMLADGEYEGPGT
jgi:uncharacterized protein (DUF1330 family)